MKAFSNTFSQDIQGRIGLHDFGHGLLYQRLAAWEPVAKGRMKVIGKVNRDQTAGRRWVDTHVICSVVQEFGSGVSEKTNEKSSFKER